MLVLLGQRYTTLKVFCGTSRKASSFLFEVEEFLLSGWEMLYIKYDIYGNESFGPKSSVRRNENELFMGLCLHRHNRQRTEREAR
jgi:hypothetical protein